MHERWNAYFTCESLLFFNGKIVNRPKYFALFDLRTHNARQLWPKAHLCIRQIVRGCFLVLRSLKYIHFQLLWFFSVPDNSSEINKNKIDNRRTHLIRIFVFAFLAVFFVRFCLNPKEHDPAKLGTTSVETIHTRNQKRICNFHSAAFSLTQNEFPSERLERCVWLFFIRLIFIFLHNIFRVFVCISVLLYVFLHSLSLGFRCIKRKSLVGWNSWNGFFKLKILDWIDDISWKHALVHPIAGLAQ